MVLDFLLSLDWHLKETDEGKGKRTIHIAPLRETPPQKRSGAHGNSDDELLFAAATSTAALAYSKNAPSFSREYCVIFLSSRELSNVVFHVAGFL